MGSVEDPIQDEHILENFREENSWSATGIRQSEAEGSLPAPALQPEHLVIH